MKTWHLYIPFLYPLPFALLLVAISANFGITSVEQGLLICFGGLGSLDMLSFWQILLCGIVWFPPLIIFGSRLADQLNRAVVYIFPRTQSRMRWYAKEIRITAIYACIYYLLLLMIYIASLILLDISISQPHTMHVALTAILGAVVLNQLALIICSNVLHLKVQAHFVILFLVVLYFPGQIAMNWPHNLPWLKMLYPPSQTALSLHNIPELNELMGFYFERTIPGFSVTFSVAYNVILITLIISLGAHFLRKKNLTV